MKKKWNVTLLVIFVLLACSLLWIIAVQYTKHMARQTNLIENHYKAYYLAKWGNEIWLILLRKHWVGYWLDILQNNNFIENNIITGSNFSMKIQWVSNNLSKGYPNDETCTYPFIIWSWENFLLPLFIDAPNADILKDHFWDQHFYINKSDLLKNIQITNLESPRNVWIGIIISSWGILSQTWIYFTTKIFEGDTFFEDFTNELNNYFNTIEDRDIMDWEHHPSFQNYLIIANKDNQDLSFCLTLSTWQNLPLQQTYITSFWFAGDQKIGIETKVIQEIPSYLIETISPTN